ncbi:MAG TPA: YkgJ family cysteine cluster protein [Phycisphaerales bacterium]|nr:YkgJ family cysteine cluster protein [Phycisphaerales bacterium]
MADHSEPEGRPLAEAWHAAVRTPAVLRELEAIYSDLAADVARERPVCRGSGRCCSFERYGHRLYVTGLETAYLVERLAEVGATPRLTVATLGRAAEMGTCPFQDGTACGVHPLRPLGCRIFYCDESSVAWQREAYERLLIRIRHLHDRAAVPYRYGEWRAMLRAFVPDGADGPDPNPVESAPAIRLPVLRGR